MPNASQGDRYSAGDAGLWYLYGQLKGEQALAGPPHKNNRSDIKDRQQEISFHVLNARIFRNGTREVQDCRVVLQPVSNRCFSRKGKTIRFSKCAGQVLVEAAG